MSASDRAVASKLAAVDAAAARCTAAAQHLVAAATTEATLKGKGQELEAEAAAATKVAAEQLAAAALEVALAKKVFAVVTGAVLEAAIADARVALRHLTRLLNLDSYKPSDAPKVAAATRAAANALLPIASKQALAASARADALAAKDFAQAAVAFAASTTDFYSFSWKTVEAPIKEDVVTKSRKKSHLRAISDLKSDFKSLGPSAARNAMPHLHTAARMVHREMMKHGQFLSVGEILEVLRSPCLTTTPELQAMLPHLIRVAPKLPIPAEVPSHVLVPVSPPILPEVHLPPAFHAPSTVVIHPHATDTWLVRLGNAVLGAVAVFVTNACLEQLKEYKPDFSQFGKPSVHDTPEPQKCGNIFG